MMESCRTCLHWTPPTRKRDQKDRQYKGECRRLSYLAEPLFEIEVYSTGCGECDPYSMGADPTINTHASFGCVFYQARPLPPPVEGLQTPLKPTPAEIERVS